MKRLFLEVSDNPFKNETLAQVFSCEFSCEISEGAFTLRRAYTMKFFFHDL